MMDRREFLAGLGLVAFAQDPDADPLRRPELAGRSRLPVGDLDNDPVIKALEKRLKCPCPCGLDVFTCRTTDFTCTYSPEVHVEVMDLYRRGLSAEEILSVYVERHGERALMAPPARGFNLMGYLVPGAAIVAVGSILALVLLRRHGRMTPAVPVAGTDEPPAIGTEDLERLERALEEVAD
jgi:cytochrome c-type biogenesis protein CcmH